MTYEQWHARQLETQGKIDPEAAWKAGWNAATSTFIIHGSDGCAKCDAGRITLFVKSHRCFECLAKLGGKL